MEECPVCWGSHGCSKPVGHVENGDAIHECGDYIDGVYDPCSRVIVDLDGRAWLRYFYQENGRSTGVLSQEFETKLI